MVTVQKTYQQMKEILTKAGILDAGFECDILFEHVTGEKRLLLLEITQEQQNKLLCLAQKRARRFPLQYIIGSWQFLGLELAVGPGVLIPRGETEEVCLAAIQVLSEKQSPKVLDLCSGTGALALGIQHAFAQADVTAVELSDKAFSYLKENCLRYMRKYPKSNVPLAVKGDALTFYKQLQGESLDLVVSNPPYVTAEEYKNLEPELFHEPEMALVAPENGLLFYRDISRLYYECLKTKGALVFEIGAAQGEAVARYMRETGYKSVEIHKDIAGNERIAVGFK